MVTQYHFTSWPEGGCPSSTSSVLDFINQITRQKGIVKISQLLSTAGKFEIFNIYIETVVVL